MKKMFQKCFWIELKKLNLKRFIGKCSSHSSFNPYSVTFFRTSDNSILNWTTCGDSHLQNSICWSKMLQFLLFSPSTTQCVSGIHVPHFKHKRKATEIDKIFRKYLRIYVQHIRCISISGDLMKEELRFGYLGHLLRLTMCFLRNWTSAILS